MGMTTKTLTSQALGRKAAAASEREKQEKAAFELAMRLVKKNSTRRTSSVVDEELYLKVAEKWGAAAYRAACSGSWLQIMEPDLKSYDVIIINTSGGKDSQAMMDYVVGRCRKLGIEDRIIAVHADLGRVEWKGTRELAEEQAVDYYGLRFEAVSRPQGDLLTHIELRGKFPGPSTRYCTSDHKRGQIQRVMTQVVNELGLKRQARVLNCMGLRAEESRNRAVMAPFRFNSYSTNKTKRLVHDWLPIFNWTEDMVWETIIRSEVPYHYAYDLGMPRLSCCFCIYAPREALILSGQHNTELLREYVRVEKKIQHTFRPELSLLEVLEAVERGEEINLSAAWGDA